MFVFGGGTGWAGQTYNDLHLLDTASMVWYRYARVCVEVCGSVDVCIFMWSMYGCGMCDVMTYDVTLCLREGGRERVCLCVV